MQKSLSFLYANNEKPENGTMETTPFIIVIKRIKYLGIHLPQGKKKKKRPIHAKL